MHAKIVARTLALLQLFWFLFWTIAPSSPSTTAPGAVAERGACCADLSRSCSAPDVFIVAVLLTSVQVLCAIGFEGPTRRSLFRRACTRPPQRRAFTHGIPNSGIWPTAARPSRMQKKGTRANWGFVLRCCRSFAPSYPRRHGTFRSIRTVHTKPTSRANQKGQVLTMFFYCLALDSRSIVIQQNRPPHAIHFATPPYRLSPKDSNQIGC
jgi:hypothetical protein